MSRLTRRTPLQPGGELRRTGSLPRRTELRPVSAKRAADRPRRQSVRAEVEARDGGCLLALQAGRTLVTGWDLDVPEMVARIPFCHGPLTPHHLIKAWKGGLYIPENIVTLCAGHNTWVEDDPDPAWALGFVVREGETLESAHARLLAHGLVREGQLPRVMG